MDLVIANHGHHHFELPSINEGLALTWEVCELIPMTRTPAYGPKVFGVDREIRATTGGKRRCL